MRVDLQRFLALILGMACAWTLASGRTVGYRCDCGETVRVVAGPDCHQFECHPGHRHADGCETDEDHPSDSPDHSHEHPAVKVQAEWLCSESNWNALPLVATAAMPPPAAWQLPPMAIPFRVDPTAADFDPPPPRRSFLTPLLVI
jgi:hypothetical protein